MVINNENDNSWGSQRTQVIVQFCQIMGLSLFANLVQHAILVGPTGYILVYTATSLLGGIPLLYMEFIISQFTARDCIGVWRARPCVSHIGYILVSLQVLTVLYNHVMNSFVFHYLLISFESPIPYYACGSWATEDCNILTGNFTVNDDCIRHEEVPSYCDHLYTTFPEYQHWRYNILGKKIPGQYYIAWRVCLASGLLCSFMYISVVRGKTSVKWILHFITFFPMVSLVIILMCSMVQKGVVVMYDYALDIDFSEFIKKFSFSRLVADTVQSLGIGTGMAANLASCSSFREPVYSNTVVTVVVIVGVSVLAICVSAMMGCPYAYEYAIDPYKILGTPITLIFEKIPRLLYEYRYKYFYLLLMYGSLTALGTGTNVVQILQFLEMSVARNAKVAKYPGMTSFLGILGLFFISLPLMCDTGVHVLVQLNKTVTTLSLFIVLLEIAVFVIWYGVNKFSEDVHFMQGLQPKNYMKSCWVLSTIILCYTFCVEVYEFGENLESDLHSLGWYTCVAYIGLIVVVFILQLSVAACKKKFYDALRLDPSWGPKSELLQRSRAMFTAQAMTKEYLYRQYHLQAGVMARQRRSNTRTQQPQL